MREQRSLRSFDGYDVHYDVLGTPGPRPTAILLNGYLAGTEDWYEPAVRAVADSGRQVVLMEHRAHGRAEPITEPLPHDALPRDLIALMDLLAQPSYALVCYSMGSIIALRASVLDREAGHDRVERIVLGGMGHDLTDAGWARPRWFARAMLEDPPTLARAAELRDFVRDVRGLDVPSMGHVQAAHPHTSVEQLATLTMPVLVACGDEDSDNGDASQLAAMLPRSTLVRFPGNHLSAATSPDWASAIATFLEQP